MDVRASRGDTNQITRDYFDSLLLEMRLIGSDLPDISLSLFGETFSTPVMTAALSHLNKQHPDGMVELARGAKSANAVMWAGMGDEAEMEAMAETGARVIKIIKPYADESLIFQKIEHAVRAGAFALGMDIDHAFGHRGGYDVVLGHEMRPKTLAEIKSYVAAAKLPFIIKGVLSERDAALCLEAGVKGIVVSHHHGILPCAIPPLKILPQIVKLVDKRMAVFVDCGVERGIDVFKALALGADAVSVGRALMEPLSTGGAREVADTIASLSAELSRAMAMTGSRDIRSIDPAVIRTL